MQHFLSAAKLPPHLRPPWTQTHLFSCDSNIIKTPLHNVTSRITQLFPFFGVLHCVCVCVCRSVVVWDSSRCRFGKESLTQHTLFISASQPTLHCSVCVCARCLFINTSTPPLWGDTLKHSRIFCSACISIYLHANEKRGAGLRHVFHVNTKNCVSDISDVSVSSLSSGKRVHEKTYAALNSQLLLVMILVNKKYCGNVCMYFTSL